MRLLGREISFSSPPRLFAKRDASSLTMDLKDPTSALMSMFLAGASSATGITVTPLKALGVACVFACIRVRADAISSLPINVHQVQVRQRRMATEHAMNRYLELKPNDEMTSVDMMWAVEANLCLHGKAFIEIVRDGDLDPVELYPIESNRMDVSRHEFSKKLVYRVTDTGKRLLSRNVCHFKSNTLNGVNSLNTTQTVRECIALALAMQDNAAKFFGNGSRPNGVLKHPGSLSAGAAERLKDQFEEQSGGKNLYRLLMLEEGAEYVATRSENKDSQFLESKDSQNLEICRVWGVPPHKVGIVGAAPRANVEQENISFATDVIRPECRKIEAELNVKCFSDEELDQGYRVFFDLDAMQRGDMASRMTAYGAGRQWGILTANDCRFRENLDALPGGDVLLQPINMADVTKVSEIQMANKQPAESEGGTGGKPNRA